MAGWQRLGCLSKLQAVSSYTFGTVCRLGLDQVCRAWNKDLHAGAAAAAAWETLRLTKHLSNRIGVLGEEGAMAAWAIRHRHFVKELIIDHGFHDQWVMVSMLVDKASYSHPCPFFAPWSATAH